MNDKLLGDIVKLGIRSGVFLRWRFWFSVILSLHTFKVFTIEALFDLCLFFFCKYVTLQEIRVHILDLSLQELVFSRIIAVPIVHAHGGHSADFEHLLPVFLGD